MATNFAKCCLAASAMFMVASIFGTISDPTLDSPASYFEPFLEQRLVEDAGRHRRRMLLEHRDAGHQRLLTSDESDEAASDEAASSSSAIDIRSISDQVSKMIAKDVASFINLEKLSNLRQSTETSAQSEASGTARDELSAATDKPVKVFILMGQSNMVGQGEIYGDYDGTLEYAVHKKKRYQHLLHSNGANTDTNSTTWAFKKNVRYAFINSNKGTFSIKRNDWLSVGGPRNKVGPEIEIGWILGDQYPDEPILLLKTCTGHRSLGWDLLPPGSKRFESNGEVYAGYHDVTEKWNKGSEPETVEDFEAFLDNSNGWYGGKQYDLDTRNAKKVLNRLENFYPGAKNGFEISGFFYWQGEKDRRTDAHTERYEENLVQFIRSVRKDFDAPEAPFVVSSVGFNGHNMEGRTRKIHQAQMAVDGNRRKYPDFEGNVKAVDARSIWRDEMKQSKQEEHYGYNAEAYMEVGSLMGWSMVQLLKQL